MAANDSSAVYLSWTATETGEDANSLAGTIHDTRLEGSQVVAQEIAFTGVQSGSNLTLTVDQWFGSTSITGTVTHKQLILRLPDPDGSLSEAILVPGSIDDHNANVVTLQGVADQVAAEEIAAQIAEAEQQAEQDQAAASLRTKETEFWEAVSYLDQSYTEADTTLSTLGYSIDTAGYLLDTLTSLVDDMDVLIADGPVDGFLRDSVGFSLDAIHDTRTSIEQTIDDAFADYSIGVILETLPGDAEWVQTTATAFQEAGGNPDQVWPGWHDLAASVDQKIEEFSNRSTDLVNAAGEVGSGADAELERAIAIAATVGVGD